MYLPIWLGIIRRRLFGSVAAGRRRLRRRSGSVGCRVARSCVRPLLENLEDRLAPSVTTINVNDKSDTLDNPTTVTAATLGGKVTLLDAIHAANNSGSSGGNSYVINLQANTTYDLTSINNYWYGPNGLPSIFSNITINGNGATIQRDSSAANFRLFYVSGGIDGPPPGSLTLENLTLQGGVAQGGESDLGGSGLGAGGAIFSQGTLTLTGVTLTNNEALGGTSTPSVRGYGGGGMGGNGNLASAGGFGGALDLPAGYAGGVGGNGGSGNAGGGGGGGGGFGPSDTGSSGSGSAGGVGGGQGGFGGSGGGFTGTYLGDGGGGSFGVGGSGGTGGAFGIGGNASLGITAGGGGGGVGGGGSSDGNSGFDADGGAGGFGGGGGIGFGGGNGGFGGGGGGFVAGTPGRGGFGGGNGSAFRSTSTPTGGGGAGMGGGIFSMMGTLSLTNCTLTANSAVGGNGANGGSGFGGAIFNLDSNLNITFCTIAANTVQGGTGLATGGAADGGAVYNLAYGNNVATGAAQSSTATILDSILSNSSGGNDLVNNIVNGANLNTAAVALTGPNLVMASTGIGISGTAPLTADPQLGPLQNNGGLTPTMAITSSSPAYRVGSTVPGVPTDQRGANRHIPPSLGSFEPVPGTVITASNVTAFYSESAHSVTLTADVTSVAGPVNEGTVTFSVLKGGVVIGTATTSGTVVDGFASVNYTLPAGLGIASYTIKAVYSGGPDLTGSTDASHFLIIKAANVFTTAQAASAVYSLSSQTVALKATVVDQSNPADIVSTGSVKFTIMAGNAILGSVVGGVVNNAATASYTVPAGLAAGGYAIIVSYSDTPSNFADGGDQNAILTIANSAATTSAANISIGYRPGAQNVTLSAAVTSTAGTVEEGTVTFTLMQGSTVIGKPTISGTVNDDEASAVYALPAATAAGNYTIDVQYIDNGGNFADGGDSSGTLTVKPAPVTTTAFNATTAFSPNSQTVTLQAALADNAFPSDPINEGDVTFTILNGKTQVGSVQGAVNGVSTGGGAASAVFDVPKGLAAGSYTIEVSYGDTPSNFIDNGDTNSTLTITPANVTVTASNASTFYSPNAQTLTFNATLADTSNSKDAVDEGVVVFTIMNGSNIIGNGRGAVSGNSVSANFDWSAGRAPPGNYTIAVSYIDSNGNFVDSGDTNGILNVAPAAVTVTANNASIAVPQSQTVTLSATIADDSFPTDTVDEGVVTFTIESGGAPVATPVQGTVSGGIASADFTVPAGLAAGSYTIAVAYSDKSGNYKDAGNDNSASLTFLLLPAVTTNPTNQTVSAGATVLFTAAASANPPATVQWQVSSDGGNTFSNIAGATSATLSLSNILPSQNGYEYQAVFTNELGSATTSAAILGVLSAPAVATNPNNQSVAVGGSATFTAVGNGNPPPAVQWQVSTDQGGTWTNINGATSTTLALSNIQASQNGTEYHAVFSNSGGKATTNAAVLVVQTPPTVTANPNNQNILAGQTAVFSATATGTPTPSVQWQVSSDNGATWINLIGANAATLTLSNVPSSLNGDLYRAVFSNSLGTFTTSAAVLSVQASPVITSATGAVFTIGQSVNFTVQATGTPPPTFALFGSLPSGISFIDNGNGTASLGGAAAAGAQGTYYFTIAASNGIGNGSTQSFTLRVNAAPPQPSPPPSPPTPPPQVVTLNIPPLLAFFDAFMQTVETTNADGSETLTSSFFGTPWIVATFDSFGNFVGASLLGFAFPNWIWYL